jgi:hypothetical protein
MGYTRGQVFQSKYLGKDDIPAPVVASIRDFQMEEVNNDHGGKDSKGILYFHGNFKPMILNSTNWSILESLFGDNTDLFINKQIEIYNDPYVSFKGKQTGGLRFREPGTGVPAPTANQLYPQGAIPQAAQTQPQPPGVHGGVPVQASEPTPWGAGTPPMQYTTAKITEVRDVSDKDAHVFIDSGTSFFTSDTVQQANARLYMKRAEPVEISWVFVAGVGNKLEAIRDLGTPEEVIPI